MGSDDLGSGQLGRGDHSPAVHPVRESVRPPLGADVCKQFRFPAVRPAWILSYGTPEGDQAGGGGLMDRKPKLTLKQGKARKATPKSQTQPTFRQIGFSPLVSSMSFRLLPRDYDTVPNDWASRVFGFRVLRGVRGFPLFQGELLAPTGKSI